MSELINNFNISLSNSLGIIIWEESQNNMDYKDFHFNIPTINLPAGVYYCRISTGKNIVTKPVVVL